MNVALLSKYDVVRPTRLMDQTFPRHIVKVDDGFVVYRIDLDGFGSLGESMWCTTEAFAAWVARYAATSDGLLRQPPALDCGHKGVQFYAKDSDGQWHYVNHAGTWQTCPPPFASA